MKNSNKVIPVEVIETNIVESENLIQPKKTLSKKIKKDGEIFKEVLEKDNIKNVNKIKKSKNKIVVTSSWIEKF